VRIATRAQAAPLVVGLVVVASWYSRERPASEPATTARPAAPSSAASTTDRATDRFPTSKGDLVVSPLEHASILFGWDDKAIYVDPSWQAIADEKLPLADVIFVTEERYDHLDASAIQRLTRPGTIVVAPGRVADEVHVDVVMREGDTRVVHGVAAAGVPLDKLERDTAPGSVLHERGLGEGYVLDFGGTRVYVSGDTECTPEMRALEHVDAAFVAVKPPVAMSGAEAVRCVNAFRPRVVFPYHDWRVDLSDMDRDLAPGISLRVRDFYPRAGRWRTEAARFCSEGQRGICRDLLDRARALDPLGEGDPHVVALRAQVRAWQSPFPPWW
jgi:L-ascorbate metabolism protein UlaG (beta-lactamase superfamily)